MTATDLSTVFYRVNDEGTADLLDVETGRAITRIEQGPTLWPIGSDVSARYEHPEGITITVEDAERMGIQGDL